MVRSANIVYEGLTVPVRVKMEYRKSVRYSITKKSVNMLVPRFYNKAQVVSEFKKLNEWCQKQFVRNPDLLERFKSETYENNSVFVIYNQPFVLKILTEPRKTCSAHISKQKDVIIKVPDDIDKESQNRLIGLALSRVFSNFFLGDIKRRVETFNKQYFNERIDNIRLKNNQSTWGSCSTKRNINLSSRLLLAPSEVLDYVIVHELSHLKEMNHSSKFWNIVESVMPDYRLMEEWLTANGGSLKF